MTPQELKNSILQLAIQGKLVEQRADEGTGKELLEKIFAEKNAEGAKGKGRKLTRRRGVCEENKTSAPSASPREKIPDDEKPFDIPETGWLIDGRNHDSGTRCCSFSRLRRRAVGVRPVNQPPSKING